MPVFAITPVHHGKPGGEVVDIKVGEEVKGLSDDEVVALIAAGSAVEIGQNRRYSAAPAIGTADVDTLKRDLLLARASGGDDLLPGLALAVDQAAFERDPELAEQKMKEAQVFNQSITGESRVPVNTDTLARNQPEAAAQRQNQTAEQAQKKAQK